LYVLGRLTVRRNLGSIPAIGFCGSLWRRVIGGCNTSALIPYAAWILACTTREIAMYREAD